MVMDVIRNDPLTHPNFDARPEFLVFLMGDRGLVGGGGVSGGRWAPGGMEAGGQCA